MQQTIHTLSKVFIRALSHACRDACTEPLMYALGVFVLPIWCDCACTCLMCSPVMDASLSYAEPVNGSLKQGADLMLSVQYAQVIVDFAI